MRCPWVSCISLLLDTYMRACKLHNPRWDLSTKHQVVWPSAFTRKKHENDWMTVTNYVASVQYIHIIPFWKANKTQYNHNIPNCTAKTPMSAQWGPLCRRVTAWVYFLNGAHPPENAPMGGFLVFIFVRYLPPWALLRGLPVHFVHYPLQLF